MTAAITEPTYLSNCERGICLHSQARFRFGKYKGRMVHEVWQCDAQYLRWLGNQDWFVEKQQTLVTLDEPEPLPQPARTSRDVTILESGCALIRPRAWAAR
jgi:uncharacterized protein (DUF3820 family)